MPLETITLKPSKARQAVEACIAASQPVCLWGEPGVGKSALIAQIARDAGRTLIDFRVSLREPTDLIGLPTVVGGRSTYATPDFLPDSGRGLFFLDELNRGVQMMQNASLQLVRDRTLGDYTLPIEWAIAAACNGSGIGTSPMSEALRGRFVHVEVVPDVDDFSVWGFANGLDPLVIAFLRFRSNLLIQPVNKGDRGAPSPRTWEFVSHVVKQNAAPDIERALVAGAVGHGAAIEFLSYASIFRQVPNIDAIMLNPQAAPVPTETSAQYATASALALRADESNFGRVLTFLDRMPTEFGVFAVRDATTRDPAIKATPEFTRWFVAHRDVA